MSLEKKIDLQKNENILAVIKKSLWRKMILILIAFIFIIVPSFFAFWLFSKGSYGIISFGLSVLVGVLIFLKIVIERKKNLFIITNQRVIKFESKNFFSEEIFGVNFYEIQNILFIKNGLFSKVFNYGDVVLENNQRQKLMILSAVASPEKVFHLTNKIKNDFWLKEKDLDTEEIIDLFINNVSLMEKDDLNEIKEYIEDVLNNRAEHKK